MLRYIQKLIEGIVTSINRAPISQDDKTILKHYSVFLSLGVPTMVVFGLYNLTQANYFLFSLVLLSAFGLVVGWFLLQHLRSGRIIYRINIILFGVLILYMLLIGGEGGSKILWMYTFPLISFFLLGKTEGLVWSATALTISIILFWNPFNLSIAYYYPNSLKIRFLTTYLIVSAITYWFEYFRYRYRVDIERKNNILQQEITERRQVAKEREELVEKLQQALDEVKTLSGFLPICSSCKKIRDDKGYWNQIEDYVSTRTDAQFSHGICPDCLKILYPEYCKKNIDKDM